MQNKYTVAFLKVISSFTLTMDHINMCNVKRVAHDDEPTISPKSAVFTNSMECFIVL